jgi:formylglycine-generating enzyme required for sulfatase activity
MMKNIFKSLSITLLSLIICGCSGPKAGDVITNSTGMKLFYVPAGEFMMDRNFGKHDEMPALRVKLSQDFFMGQFEVTQEQWKAVMGTNPSKFKGDNNPVEQVNWNEAMEFCKKLSAKDGRTYTLPTEAQWEYACRAGRAGSAVKYSFGDSASSLGDYAWYADNSGKKTHPVGLKKPNIFGLYDMHGNVWEWCMDWDEKGYYTKESSVDPVGRQSARNRVIRGGGFGDDVGSCAVFSRLSCYPYFHGGYIGFRVCLD